MKLIIMVYFFFFSINTLFPNNNVELFNALNMQTNDLNDNEKRLLEFTEIIIIHPNRFPIFAYDVNGIVLSDIVISRNLVPCSFDRFYISHYLRNQMNSQFLVYDPDHNRFDPIVEPYYFPNYDLYIHRNAELICKVIYHFISDNFYKVYINFPYQSYLLLTDNRLGIQLELLITNSPYAKARF